MNFKMNFHDEYQKRVQAIDEIIKGYLPSDSKYLGNLFDAISYSLMAGGKRIRPMLMKETYHIFGGKGKVIEPFMAAIEMIHTYSLIHDDLPAIDNDDYRRGRKTTHIVFGEGMAILTGDALLNYAFEVAARAFTGTVDDIVIAKAFKILTEKPGIHGMIGGQVVDVESVGHTIDKEKLDYIHELKTGALIEASMMIGAVLANADEEKVILIEQIAKDVGMAFQIQDDILDVIGDEEVLGKPTGSDEKNLKTTYVSLLGMEKAKAMVEELLNKSINRMKIINNDCGYMERFLIHLINREK